MDLSGRTLVLGGATSVAGFNVAQRLVAAGARVIATGRSRHRLDKLDAIGAEAEVSDATSLEAMSGLAARLDSVDGVIPLVGGWRGGGGLVGQTDLDFQELMPSLQAVRAMSRAFDAALRNSSAGRFAIVSSVATDNPLAGGANYVAVKAASEAWARAVAHGYAKYSRDADEPLRAASVIFRARSLDPRVLSDAVLNLWSLDAPSLNDHVVNL